MASDTGLCVAASFLILFGVLSKNLYDQADTCFITIYVQLQIFVLLVRQAQMEQQQQQQQQPQQQAQQQQQQQQHQQLQQQQRQESVGMPLGFFKALSSCRYLIVNRYINIYIERER